MRKVIIASDHAGFELKEYLKSHSSQISWVDLGPADNQRVDYPDYADRVAKSVLKESDGGGIGLLICGSGQGMAMRANRYRGIRAALCWNEESAKLAREHNNANVLCLGARMISAELAEKILTVFLNVQFEGGRHAGRVDKIDHSC